MDKAKAKSDPLKPIIIGRKLTTSVMIGNDVLVARAIKRIEW